MDVDENLKQTYIQYDPAPRKGNEVSKKRVPDYFLWKGDCVMAIDNAEIVVLMIKKWSYWELNPGPRAC